MGGISEKNGIFHKNSTETSNFPVIQTEIYLSFRLSCPNAINPAVTARGSIISCSPNGSVTME